MSNGPATTPVSTAQSASSPSDAAGTEAATSARPLNSERRTTDSAPSVDAWLDPITSASREPRNEHLPPRRQSNPADLMNFRVDLDLFRGPLDLLLYLVRKHEVNLIDIPIAPITELLVTIGVVIFGWNVLKKAA